MPENGPPDAELLAAWLRDRHEAAFHALVARYAGLVHQAVETVVIEGDGEALGACRSGVDVHGRCSRFRVEARGAGKA